jgi:hypothetical protein
MDTKNEYGTGVTHQTSNVDDDLQKHGNVIETNVASVALGKSLSHHACTNPADPSQPPLSRHRSLSCFRSL